MKIKLIAVGKTDNQNLKQLIADYQNRLKHYIGFEFLVIPDIKNNKNLSKTQQKTAEGEAILKQIVTSDQLLLLDENGKSYDSVKFSKLLQKKMLSGCKQLIFVIGGPYGFSEAVYKRAQSKIALSAMTFSHQMVRLFAIEQLYRAFTIIKNEPYHHK
jgi:23S rRNA (pseudouridine1915-N3)-methyltransferase